MNTPIWYGNIGVLPAGATVRWRWLRARLFDLGLAFSGAMDRLIERIDRLTGCRGLDRREDRHAGGFGCHRVPVLVTAPARCRR